MTKVRKQKRKKKFRYASKKTLARKRNRGQAVLCKEMKNDWDASKSVAHNMAEMGLVYDVNKSLGIPSNLDAVRNSVSRKRRKKNKKPLETSDNEDEVEERPCKAHVAEALEKDALEKSRVSNFRLPKGVVMRLCYLISKYGEDYKAMARDPKNYYQETWKQIRQKIFTFKKIPEQYNEFLKSQEKTSMDTS